MNKAAFFDTVRRSIYKGRMTPGQLQGLETLLAAWRGSPLAYAAYGLATAHHETAFTMQPIKEYGGEAYLRRMYDPTGSRPALAKRNGNTTPGDGVKYAGRGYVQLTWKDNYKRAGDKIGVDLVRNPDRAMEPEIAATIMREGMENGWFTGKRLSDYLTDSRADYVNARRVINGTDKAREIAAYARAFAEALRDAGWGDGPPAKKGVEISPPAAEIKPEPVPKADEKDIKPWWHEIPIIRQVAATFSAVGISASTLLEADKSVIITLAILSFLLAAWAVYWQAKRRKR